jgi:hypothetical protein
MKRKSLIEAVSPESRDFIEASIPHSAFAQTRPEEGEEEASHGLVPELPEIASDPAEKKEIVASVPVVKQRADEIPLRVLAPLTFRLPQGLIEDLARAGELRALSWQDREGNTWLPINAPQSSPFCSD